MNIWIVIKVTTSPCGKGDLKAEERVIGYSEHKQAKELFSLLEKAYNIEFKKSRELSKKIIDKNNKLTNQLKNQINKQIKNHSINSPI